MGTNPLRIGIFVDASDLEKLAIASQQVATSVSSMTEQFLSGSMSAKEIAESAGEAAAKLISSTPAIQAQAVGYENLKAALSLAKTEVKESAAIMAEAGGEAGVSAGFLRNYQEEQAKVAILSKAVSEATQLNKEAFSALAESGSAAIGGLEKFIAALDMQIAAASGAAVAVDENTAAISENAAVGTESAAAMAKNAAMTKESTAGVTIALNEAGEQAMRFGAAIIQGSEAAQVAGQRYLNLTRQVAAARAAMKEAEGGTLSLGQAEGISAEQTNKYLTAKSAVAILTKQQKIAEEELNVALNESYITQTKLQAASATRIATVAAPVVSTVAAPATAATAAETAAQTALQEATNRVTIARQRLTAAESESEIASQAVYRLTTSLDAEENKLIATRLNAALDTEAEASAELKAAQAKEIEARATVELIRAQAARVVTAIPVTAPVAAGSVGAGAASASAGAATAQATTEAAARTVLQEATDRVTAAEQRLITAEAEVQAAGEADSASTAAMGSAEDNLLETRLNAAVTAEAEARSALSVAQAKEAEARATVELISSQDAAAGEGMVASEIALATAESQDISITTRLAQARAEVTAATQNLRAMNAAYMESIVSGSIEEQTTASNAVTTATQRWATAKKDLISAETEAQITSLASTTSTVEQTTAESENVSATVRLQSARTELTAATSNLAQMNSLLIEASTSGSLQEQAAAADAVTAAQQREVDAKASVAAIEKEVATATTATSSSMTTQTAAMSHNVASTSVLRTGLQGLVQDYKLQGISAKQAETELLSYGFSQTAVTSAMSEAGFVIEKTTTDTAKLSAEEAFLGRMFAITGVEAQKAAVQFDAVDKSVAYTAGRMGAVELGVGQLGFGFARLATVVPGLTAAMDLLFIPFAAIAFIEILDQGIKKVQEWADATEKSAEETAKFEREMSKGAEAVDRMNERLAGQIGAIAEDAEKTADAGNKVIDLTADITALNKELENKKPAGFLAIIGAILGVGANWSALAEGGKAAWQIFDDAAVKATNETETFNRKLAEQAKHMADMPAVIQQAALYLQKLKEEKEAYANAPGITLDREATLAAFDKLIHDQAAGLEKWKSVQTAADLERLADQRTAESSQLTEHQRGVEARISYDEAQAKILTKIHLGSIEDETTELLRLETERETAESAKLNERQSRLTAQMAADKAAGRKTDLTGEQKAINDDRAALVLDGEKKRFEIISNSNLQIISRDQATATAEIEADSKIIESKLKLAEAQAKISFEHAGTPAAAEAAVQPLIKATTDLYDEQIQAKQKLATVKTAELPTNAPRPTAQFGTEEYNKQIEAMPAAVRNVAPQIYTELLKLSSDAVVLKTEETTRVVDIEKEKVTKIGELNKEQLKFSQELAKQDEDIALKKLSAQEQAIAGEARLEEMKRVATASTTLGKQVAVISVDESELDKLKAIEEQKYTIEVEFKEKEKGLLEATVPLDDAQFQKQKEAIAKAQKEIEILTIAHNAKLAELNQKQTQDSQKAADAMTQAYMRAFGPINGAFSTFMSNITSRTMTVSLAFQHLGHDIVRSTIESLAQAAQHWAEHFVIINVLEKTSWGQRLATILTGHATEFAVNKTAAEAQVMIDAGKTFAATFTSVMESLPFPANIAAAPGIAGAAEATVLAGGSFEQGGILPIDMAVFGHAGEMVLPQHISQGVQEMVQSGKSGGGAGGDTHVHINWSAMDSKSLQDFLHQPGVRSQFSKAMKTAVRNGMRVR